MKPERCMLVAGEPSGDSLAAEFVQAFRQLPEIQAVPWPPEFFGAGGPHMTAAGVRLELDLTAHAVFGLSDVLRHYFKFRRIFNRLFRLALTRRPDVIVLVDFAGFNLRLARAVKGYVRSRTGAFLNWNPKIVHYVSPQVWASRERRAGQLSRHADLLLSIFPFEKAWYAERVPQLRVEFVGHPLLDRYPGAARSARPREADAVVTSDEPRGHAAAESVPPAGASPLSLLVLLPGSRKRELQAHLPVMIEAARRIKSARPIRVRMVLPNSSLVQFAARWTEAMPELEVRAQGLAESLAAAHLAIASSGTVTMECAFFGVPTVVIYRTPWLTYEIARRIVTVKHIAMPNLLAGEAVYPELIQSRATAENVVAAALELLNNPSRVAVLKSKLETVIDSLGGPGASQRAAQAVFRLLDAGATIQVR